jgi:outer membrane protein TolC
VTRVVRATGLALALAGCAPERYVGLADAEVAAVLASAQISTLAGREQWIEQPEELPPEQDSAEAETTGTRDAVAEALQPVHITLESAMHSAFVTAREFLTQEESLYLAGLGMTSTRFSFGPQLAASVDAIWADSEVGAASTSVGGSFSVSQRLRTGGTLSASAGLDTGWIGGPGAARSWASSADFSLSQPLARGAGEAIAYEALTQAERDIVYAMRDYELFRQDHAIAIISQYFDLIRRKTQLVNDQRSYVDAVFDREKSDALLSVDRTTQEAVFLAKRREIDTENQLLIGRTDFEFALDAFRIRLGLPEASAITIGDEEPPFERIRLDPDSAVSVALHNRLDLLSSREQVEDSRRSLAIARDGLLPDVDLTLGYGLGDTSGALGHLGPHDWDTSAALSFKVPIQRLSERNSYRSALISHDRVQRGFELELQNTERDIRDSLRELDRLEKQIALAELQIKQDDRAVVVTEIRYEAGEVDNRALLEARQSLIDTRNALIQVQVSHYIGRLRLYRDLGLLFIEADGTWRI